MLTVQKKVVVETSLPVRNGHQLRDIFSQCQGRTLSYIYENYIREEVEDTRKKKDLLCLFTKIFDRFGSIQKIDIIANLKALDVEIGVELLLDSGSKFKLSRANNQYFTMTFFVAGDNVGLSLFQLFDGKEMSLTTPTHYRELFHQVESIFDGYKKHSTTRKKVFAIYRNMWFDYFITNNTPFSLRVSVS
jgi:hypothetical protein